jgi:hypothetical protein
LEFPWLARKKRGLGESAIFGPLKRLDNFRAAKLLPSFYLEFSWVGLAISTSCGKKTWKAHSPSDGRDLT